MFATRIRAGLTAALGLWLGSVSPSAALSFDEFEAMAEHQKEIFISTVLHYYYFDYKSDPARAQRANCMTDLERRSTDAGAPYLHDYIEQEIVRAGAGAARRMPVEHVIEQSIARACQST